jgi:hypothetical protein
MFIKFVTLLLVCLMINVSGASVAFARHSNNEGISKKERKIRKHAEKIKKGVEKLGTGKDSVVKVKLRDKSKIKGYISNIEDNSFTIVDIDGKATVVNYTNVKQIKGNNLNGGVWIAIGFGVALAVIGIILLAVREDS